MSFSLRWSPGGSGLSVSRHAWHLGAEARSTPDGFQLSPGDHTAQKLSEGWTSPSSVTGITAREHLAHPCCSTSNQSQMRNAPVKMKETMMKIVVIGGTGLIGSKLVNKLRQQGHEAVAASPNSGVNTLTGEGLAEVLKGASVVVDVSNSPSWEDAEVLKFFETSTRNLLSYEAAAGVKHHVALSVVGTDRLSESGYFRAKIAQEKLIKESSIPYSIVHATQFFEFLK